VVVDWPNLNWIGDFLGLLGDKLNELQAPSSVASTLDRVRGGDLLKAVVFLNSVDLEPDQ
jgi:hypothetical protein